MTLQPDMPTKKQPKRRPSEIRDEIRGLDMSISEMLLDIDELQKELESQGEEREFIQN